MKISETQFTKIIKTAPMVSLVEQYDLLKKRLDNIENESFEFKKAYYNNSNKIEQYKTKLKQFIKLYNDTSLSYWEDILNKENEFAERLKTMKGFASALGRQCNQSNIKETEFVITLKSNNIELSTIEDLLLLSEKL